MKWLLTLVLAATLIGPSTTDAGLLTRDGKLDAARALASAKLAEADVPPYDAKRAIADLDAVLAVPVASCALIVQHGAGANATSVQVEAFEKTKGPRLERPLKPLLGRSIKSSFETVDIQAFKSARQGLILAILRPAGPGKLSTEDRQEIAALNAKFREDVANVRRIYAREPEKRRSKQRHLNESLKRDIKRVRKRASDRRSPTVVYCVTDSKRLGKLKKGDRTTLEGVVEQVAVFQYWDGDARSERVTRAEVVLRLRDGGAIAAPAAESPHEETIQMPDGRGAVRAPPP